MKHTIAGWGLLLMLTAAPLAPAVARLGPRVTSFGRRVLMAPVTGLDDLAAEYGVELDEAAMEEVRNEALAMERRGYAYGETAPARQRTAAP